MLFQTEKLSSFHCCKLWILLYFFVNIESITASELRCEPPMPAPINGMVRCTKSNLIGSECYFGCKPGYELTSNSSSLCSYDFVRLITKWSPPSPPDCTLHQIVKKEDGCYGSSRIDMVFVLDGSGSIRAESFEHVKTWTKKVGELMIRVFDDHLHIGIVQFASRPQVETELEIFLSPNDFDMVVDGIRQLRGNTYTVDAMNTALEVLSVYRPKCPFDYQKIMVLLTDGRSSQTRDGLLHEASILQDAGVKSFAVGVKDANYEELRIIANGHEDRIFRVYDFEYLDETAHDVQVGIAQTLEITCEPRTAPENGDVSCTYANELGSECTYTCDEGYFISNPLLSTTYCKIHTTAVGGWSSIPPTCIPKCYEDSRIDMVFVLDGSGSISSYDFEHVKTWTKNVGELMIKVFGQHLHMGIVQFASRPQVETELEVFLSPNDFDMVVDGIRQLNGNTYTVDAMNKALEVLSVYRPKCPGDYQKIMVLLTDGHSTQSRTDLENIARILQDAGVKSFAVGVGFANHDELRIIANGHEDRIFRVYDFEYLDETAHDVQVGIAQTLEITCEPRTAPENGKVSCTYANELGSECTYTCDAGYTISDPLLSTTYCKIQTTAVGGWSSIPPTCIPNCEDKNGNCEGWARRNFCTIRRFSRVMTRICPKACGICH